MPNGTLEEGIAAHAKSDELGRLCANMAEGLHAMAQPLTILRSAVAGSASPSVTVTSLRRYLDISSQQVERVCVLFECLQDLVIAQQHEAERASLELTELLGPVIEDQKAAMEVLGVELAVILPGVPVLVLGDVARTLQALFVSLKMVGALSARADVVELSLGHGDGFAEVIVQNKLAHGRSLNSLERLGLTLAAANILSQQGRFEWVEDPFKVSLMLPLVRCE